MLSVIMLSVIMLSVIMLSVIMPNVNMQRIFTINVVAPKYLRYWKYHLLFDDGKIFADIV